MEYSVVLTPMPRAISVTAAALRPGDRVKMRNAFMAPLCRNRQSVSIAFWGTPPACYLQSMITRRRFLGGASALALSNRLFAAETGSTKPSADLEKLGAIALNEAKRLKAS